MSAPAAVRAITRPASTYQPGHRPCTRCGIIRDMQKRGQQFCLDCRRFALADGWVESSTRGETV